MAGLELEDLYAETCPHCIALSVEEFLRSEYLNATGDLRDALTDFKAGRIDDARAKLFELYGNNLRKGVGQVYKPTDPAGEVDYLYRFNANVTKFAGFKANYAIKVLQKAATDNPAKFDDIGKKLLKTFNRFQVTEYNTAVSRARTAKQFAKFAERAGTIPNIRWIRTRSANPREQHLKYVNLVLPKNHPFWLSNQPGNLWNCKCDWAETNKPINDTVGSDAPVNPAPGLEGNPFATGEIFTDKAPYFVKENNPSALLTRINNMRVKSIKAECDKWVDETVKVRGFDKPIGFSVRGFKKFLSRPMPEKSAKNEMLLNIREVLKKATYLGELNPRVGDTSTSYLFEIVFINEKRWLVANEYAGKIPTLYSISDSPGILEHLKMK